MIEIPVWEKLYLTVEEAAALMNIGQGKIRELMTEPDCDFVLMVDKRKGLINRKRFKEFLNNRIEI